MRSKRTLHLGVRSGRPSITRIGRWTKPHLNFVIRIESSRTGIRSLPRHENVLGHDALGAMVDGDIHAQVNVHGCSFLQHRSDSTNALQRVQSSLQAGKYGQIWKHKHIVANPMSSYHPFLDHDELLIGHVSIEMIVSAHDPIVRRRVRLDLLHRRDNLRRELDIVRNDATRRLARPPGRRRTQCASISVQDSKRYGVRSLDIGAYIYCQWDVQQFVWILQCHMRHCAQVFLRTRESASFHQSNIEDPHVPG